MSGGPPRIAWSLSAEGNRHAAAEYRDAVSDLYEARIDPARTDGFYNHMEGYHLGGPVLARCRATAHDFRHTQAMARRHGVDQIRVVLQTKGEVRADYDGVDVHAKPGSIRFLDLARPWESVSEEYEFLDLIVPRDRLEPLLGGRDVHGLVIEPGAAVGKLLRAHLLAMWEMMDELSAAEAEAAGQAAIALAAGAVSGLPPLPAHFREPVERTLIAQAKAYVDARLSKPGLNPESLCQHLGLSPRSLSRLFEGRGGAAGFIRARRLDRAFRAILAPENARTSLTDIAWSHGFQSDTHFSRVFKERFGTPPRDLRATIRAGNTVPMPGDDLSVITRWFHGL